MADLPDFDALRGRHLGLIGVISMGDMGSGVARLLMAHNYAVLTNVSDRSEDTKSRALSAGAVLLPSDELLVDHSDLILSIVPPAEAYSTAERVVKAWERKETELVYADLNAVSPSTLLSISSLFTGVKFIDGSILGGPPSFVNGRWTKPIIPTSGPFSLSDIFPGLGEVLGEKQISPELGQASGLKMVFASLSKGYAAVALQSVTTAHQLGVLPELLESVNELQGEAAGKKLEQAVTGLAPKAGRWVREMEEIGKTHRENGNWEEWEGIFEAAAKVYELVAKGTVLGGERIGKRERGTTVEGVAEAVGEGLGRRKEKEE
ncbi:Putative protein of unknown function [Podospora comata]|uniref:6-phosphogluconate dehydrogenase C-terminal domain-like protein n=1 Tax=Podospora comata TaxID=48703 RepID=A0ABY6RWC3_PODCO|nr:Putative protein of unknown function [Podospora comata]